MLLAASGIYKSREFIVNESRQTKLKILEKLSVHFTKVFASLSAHSTDGSPSPAPKVVYANPKIVDDYSLVHEIFQFVRPSVLDPQNVF